MYRRQLSSLGSHYWLIDFKRKEPRQTSVSLHRTLSERARRSGPLTPPPVPFFYSSTVSEVDLEKTEKHCSMYELVLREREYFIRSLVESV